MEKDLAFSIIDQLSEAGVKSIAWTGGGEPTLHKNFNEIVSYAEGKLAQGIYTHGGHINEERAALLKKLFTFVYVSLDAADPIAYKRDKGVDRFQAACDGISRLVESKGDATIGVGYLITKQNWQEAGKAARLVRELGADYIQFRPTILYEQTDPSKLAEDTAWVSKAMRFIKEVNSVWQNAELDLDRFTMYKEWKGHGYKTCYWSVLQTVITPDGSLWTCVNLREHPEARLGSIAEESFRDIWARHKPVEVDSNCRVMCRGHIANLALDEIMSEQKHGAFI